MLRALLLAVPLLPLAAVAQERPRLVVLVAVDQLATWVLEPALRWCGEDGFRRLQRDGVSFPRCAFRHACTETGPGHATLVTGTSARGHGIIGNTWADPTGGRSVYCVEDPELRRIGTNGPAGDGGRGPRHLLAPTLGETMRAHFGENAKVVSIAWKDRSAILMAGRAADAVLWVDTTNGEFVTSSHYAEALPEWALALNRQPLAHRWFGQTWDRIGPAEAYADLVDDQAWEGRNPLGHRRLPQAITGGEAKPGSAFVGHMYLSPFANELVEAAALAALDAEQLGRDDVPDLLCIGFSANDSVGHQYGPQSVEIRDLTLRTDRQIARLLQALDQKVGAGRYVLILSADHGIAPIPEAAASAGIGISRARALQSVVAALAAGEQALRITLGVPPSGKWIQRSGIDLWIDRKPFEGRDARELANARRIAAGAIARVPGIRAAVACDDLATPSAPDDPVLRALWHAQHPRRAADLAVALEPYSNPSTTPAMHGMPYPYDQEVPLLVIGAGVRPGTRCAAPVSPGLAAVLAAHLLGIPKPADADAEIPDGVMR
jgi:predicted AlkP superfamily pyrophosphatase or phosphodiesterase